MSALRLSRRGLFGGFAALLAAPAIVRVASIMPVVKLPDHAALIRLMEQRLENFRRSSLQSFDVDFYSDGSGEGLGNRGARGVVGGGYGRGSRRRRFRGR